MSRAFSIAITACAAKFCSSAICLSQAHLLAVDIDDAQEGIVLAQGHREQRARPAEVD